MQQVDPQSIDLTDQMLGSGITRQVFDRYKQADCIRINLSQLRCCIINLFGVRMTSRQLLQTCIKASVDSDELQAGEDEEQDVLLDFYEFSQVVEQLKCSLRVVASISEAREIERVEFEDICRRLNIVGGSAVYSYIHK